MNGARRDGPCTAQAGLLIDAGAIVEAHSALAKARELAEAHGLTELLAWNAYWYVEAGLVSGDWERATAAGLEALELAERNGYQRAAVRTLFALVPIAGARADLELLERAREWFAAQGL